MGCESIAVHVLGVKNVTADALSRLVLHEGVRDAHPHRCLRKRLFKVIAGMCGCGGIQCDGFAADDGHNAQCQTFCSPSFSFFEKNFVDGDVVWVFPPEDLLYFALKHICSMECAHNQFVALAPERPQAGWFCFGCLRRASV